MNKRLLLCFFILLSLTLTGCMEKNLKFIREINSTGKDEFKNPGDIAVDNSGNIYVCDKGNHRVVKLNENGDYMGSIQKRGLFRHLEGICVDKANNVYVATTAQNRAGKLFHMIVKMNSNLIIKMKITGSKMGQRKDRTTKLYYPKDVAVDEVFRIYVVDSKHRLLIFDSSGNLKVKFVSKGRKPAQFMFPNSIAITQFQDESKNFYIYIVDELNQRIQKFNRTNKLIYTVNEKGILDHIRAPVGVAVKENGDFFVADTGAIPIVEYKANGSLSYVGGSFGKGRGEILRPGGIAYSKSNGKIYVTDYLQNKILIFSEK